MASESSVRNGRNKKAKKDEASILSASEFDEVRRYLLACPTVSNHSKAIQAALSGLDVGQKTLERDEKLKQKFALDKTTKKATAKTAEEDMEWQDVHAPTPTAAAAAAVSASGSSEEAECIDDMNEEEAIAEEVVIAAPTGGEDESSLGRTLASLAVASVASSEVTVSSPLAAVALILHAALRLDILNFVCTGIPNNNNNNNAGGGGFAAPIRALPKHQFLPNAWDKHASISNKNNINNNTPPFVALRYRKDGLGATKLLVSLLPSHDTDADLQLCVQFGPTSSEPLPQQQQLTFPLNRHVNLDGLLAAAKNSSKVPPALHYKALATLMTRFASTFDLGSLHDQHDHDHNISDQTLTTTVPSLSRHAPALPTGIHQLHPVRPVITTTTTTAHKHNDDDDMLLHPQFHTPQPALTPTGDFASDLEPGGIRDTRFGTMGNHSGNLMGPNHPAFSGHSDDLISPMPPSMLPRFHPVYPSAVYQGGDTGDNPLGRGRGRGRGGGGSRGRRFMGDPNPDHLRPPDAFGNNMFM